MIRAAGYENKGKNSVQRYVADEEGKAAYLGWFNRYSASKVHPTFTEQFSMAGIRTTLVHHVGNRNGTGRPASRILKRTTGADQHTTRTTQNGT